MLWMPMGILVNALTAQNATQLGQQPTASVLAESTTALLVQKAALPYRSRETWLDQQSVWNARRDCMTMMVCPALHA
jgi:hypothetical protein